MQYGKLVIVSTDSICVSTRTGKHIIDSGDCDSDGLYWCRWCGDLVDWEYILKTILIEDLLTTLKEISWPDYSS